MLKLVLEHSAWCEVTCSPGLCWFYGAPAYPGCLGGIQSWFGEREGAPLTPLLPLLLPGAQSHRQELPPAPAPLTGPSVGVTLHGVTSFTSCLPAQQFPSPSFPGNSQLCQASLSINIDLCCIIAM